MIRKEKIKLSRNMKTKLFSGFVCIFIGLSFSLFYQFILDLDSLLSIISICLGFSSGNFIIIMGLLEEICSDKND